MRGHEPLVEMRRSGVLPDPAVWIEDGECPLGGWLSRNWHFLEEQQPHVIIERHDVIETLDLRFTKGMLVHLRVDRGDDRAKRLFAEIRACEPKMLACCREKEVWFYNKDWNGNGKRLSIG